MKHLPFALWLFVLTSFGAWLGVMYLDTQVPYDYDLTQSLIVPDPAPQGAMVTVKWKIGQIHRICPGTIQRFFTDKVTGETVASLDTTPVFRGIQQGDDHLPRSFQLPPDLPYVVGYSGIACFQCNVLQHLFPLCIRTPEIVFHVKQGN